MKGTAPHLSPGRDRDGALRFGPGMTSKSSAVTQGIRLAILAIALATPAFAGPIALPQETHINDELRAGAAGDILRRTCPSIKARMFVVWGRLYDLRDYALSKGYTEAEVKTFLDDDAQKARVKAEAMAYLAKAGAIPGAVASYCQVGRDEIAKNTPLGQLIRSTQ